MVTPGGFITLNIPIATAGKISGTVTTAAGSLDPGVTIVLTGGVLKTTLQLTTDSLGTYATTWIPVGSYTVTASQSGHTSLSSAAQVSAGVATVLNFPRF